MSKTYIITTNWGTFDMTRDFVKRLLEIDDYNNISIIVVNNSPEENKLFNKETFKKNVLVINSGENLGYAGGINIGIKEALKDPKMDAVIITNNDIHFPKTLVKDFWNEDYENKILSPIILHRETDIIQNTGGRISIFLGGTRNINKNVHLDNYLEKKPDFLSGCMMFIPKNVLENVGLFDPEYLAYYEDVDYCLRARKLNYELKICNNIKIRHFHSASTTNNQGFKRYLIVRNSIIFAKKNLKFPESFLFIAISIIRGFFQNLKYMKYYLKGLKEGLSC